MIEEVRYRSDIYCPLSSRHISDIQVPVKAEPCQHIFERKDAEKALKYNEVCPLDKYRIQKLIPVKFVEHLLVKEAEEKECPIAYEPLINGECIVKISSCGHLFIRSAIEQWLQGHSTCPNDRSEIKKIIDVRLVETLETDAPNSSVLLSLEKIMALLEKYIVTSKFCGDAVLETTTLTDKMDHVQLVSIDLKKEDGVEKNTIILNGALIKRLYKERYWKKSCWDQDKPLDYQWRTGFPIYNIPLKIQLNVTPKGYVISHAWDRPSQYQSSVAYLAGIM